MVCDVPSGRRVSVFKPHWKVHSLQLREERLMPQAANTEREAAHVVPRLYGKTWDDYVHSVTLVSSIPQSPPMSSVILQAPMHLLPAAQMRGGDGITCWTKCGRGPTTGNKRSGSEREQHARVEQSNGGRQQHVSPSVLCARGQLWCCPMGLAQKLCALASPRLRTSTANIPRECWSDIPLWPFLLRRPPLR